MNAAPILFAILSSSLALATPILDLGAMGAAPGAVLRVGVNRTFPTIQSAIQAAQDGDVLLIDAGIYSAFDIDGKSLSILADVAQNPFEVSLPPNGPAIRVRNLAPQQTVTIQACFVQVVSGASAAIEVDGCAGAVNLTDVRAEPTVDLPNATMRAVIEVRASAAVAFDSCSVTPAATRHGEWSPGVPVGSGVDRGIAALVIESSRTRFVRCAFMGYDNRLGIAAGRWGGDGIRILGVSSVRVEGVPTLIAGGFGAEFGGSALHFADVGGPDVLSCAVNPNAFVPGSGPNQGGYLAVRHDRGHVAPGVDRFIPACLFESVGFTSLPSRIAIGSTTTVSISSFLTRPYWLLLGASGHARISGIQNTLFLDATAPLFTFAAGTLSNTGTAQVQFTIPSAPALVGYQFATQALLGAPQSGGIPAWSFATASPCVIVP